MTVTLVNISPSAARSVIVQGGAYGEHQIVSVSDGKETSQVDAGSFPVRLAPGAGAKLTIKMKRFANDPTLSFPWESTRGGPGQSARYRQVCAQEQRRAVRTAAKRAKRGFLVNDKKTLGEYVPGGRFWLLAASTAQAAEIRVISPGVISNSGLTEVAAAFEKTDRRAR